MREHLSFTLTYDRNIIDEFNDNFIKSYFSSQQGILQPNSFVQYDVIPRGRPNPVNINSTNSESSKELDNIKYDVLHKIAKVENAREQIQDTKYEIYTKFSNYRKNNLVSEMYPPSGIVRESSKNTANQIYNSANKYREIYTKGSGAPFNDVLNQLENKIYSSGTSNFQENLIHPGLVAQMKQQILRKSNEQKISPPYSNLQECDLSENSSDWECDYAISSKYMEESEGGEFIYPILSNHPATNEPFSIQFSAAKQIQNRGEPNHREAIVLPNSVDRNCFYKQSRGFWGLIAFLLFCLLLLSSVILFYENIEDNVFFKLNRISAFIMVFMSLLIWHDLITLNRRSIYILKLFMFFPLVVISITPVFYQRPNFKDILYVSNLIGTTLNMSILLAEYVCFGILTSEKFKNAYMILFSCVLNVTWIFINAWKWSKNSLKEISTCFGIAVLVIQIMQFAGGSKTMTLSPVTTHFFMLFMIGLSPLCFEMAISILENKLNPYNYYLGYLYGWFLILILILALFQCLFVRQINSEGNL